MGQKTEFHLDDWAFPEEESKTQELSETDVAIDFNDDFSELDDQAELLLADMEATELEANKSTIEINGNKINISGIGQNRNELGSKELSQEEEAFRKQIEDLFELLELEKTSDKNDGIRVYQTDSSPSRPWRFH